jgi:DNA-binding NtrC family response regulator
MAGRILVLDDEENYAEMLQELLREHNYHVDMATRPELAIERLKDVPYDLVISDYKMPVMDGSDFLKHARKLYPDLPCILVSGLMNTPELVKVANMGVTLVMEKPLDTATFLEHVARFSTQMTDEEKEDLSIHSASSESVAADICPEPPMHVSAQSPAAMSAMRKLWSLCQSSSHCFILDYASGEAGLALQDVASWRGGAEAAPHVLGFEQLVSGSHAQIAALLEDSDHGTLVRVALSELAQIAEAKAFLDKVITGVSDLFFAFVFSCPIDEAQFTAAAGTHGLILQPLQGRCSDVANYIQQALSKVVEKSGKPAITNLSDEVVFALLNYQWSSYEEIGDVLRQLAIDNGNAPFSAEVVCAKLETPLADIPAPAYRLASFMKYAQRQYLGRQLKVSGLPVTEFSEGLELGEGIHCEDALFNLPLLREDLAKL